MCITHAQRRAQYVSLQILVNLPIFPLPSIIYALPFVSPLKLTFELLDMTCQERYIIGCKENVPTSEITIV